MTQLRSDWTDLIINMQHEMERLLGDFATRKPPSVRFSPRAWAPPIDIYETADEVVILVELAGVKQEEIEIEVQGNIFVVRGERRDIKQGIRRSYSQMEILWGPFERRVNLPTMVRVEGARAFYEGGFLEVVLPKLGIETSWRVKVKGG